jgi:TIR domain
VTDIFFSYSSADRERVRPVRDALVAQGFDVFWDQQVPAGVDWDTWIRQHLASCKCAIVFWSSASIVSRNVRHEATVADQQGKLIPVLLEPLAAQQFPMGLFAQQAANLADWNADLSNDEWCKLQREYEAKLMPPWVRQRIDEKDAELVGERARRQGAERRDKVLQAQIAKEAETQQALQRELDKALDEGAALKTMFGELTQTRADAEAREAEVQRGLKKERDEALDQTAALKATVEELSRTRSDSETNVVELSRRLNEANAQISASNRQIEVAKVATRAALFARGSAMQFGSIAAAVATVAFWTYHVIWPAQLLAPSTSEPASVQQAALQVADTAADAEAQRKVEEAEQLRKDAERQANLAAEAEAKRQAAEAEQQRLKDQVQRQAKVAAEVETKLQAAQAEQQRQAKAAADADSKRKAAEAEQQRLKDEVQRQATAAADAQAKLKAAEAEQQRLKDEVQRLKAPTVTSSTFDSRPTFQVRRNIEATGPYLYRNGVASIGECEKVCKETGNCQLFTYSKTADNVGKYGCFLFDNPKASLIQNDRYDTGIRP